MSDRDRARTGTPGTARSARSRREERELFERLATHGDAAARDALIERFLPLARAVALRYQRSSEPFDDLLQVASLALIKAIDRFDAGRGMAFSSYAVPTILGELKRHFRDRTWAVHVPRDLQEQALRVDRAVGALSGTLQRQPSVADIGAAAEIDEEAVLEALQAGGARRALSFDAPHRGAEEPATLADAIGADDDGFARVEARATVDALLVILTPRERAILRLRFAEDMTQDEIGALVGISQMQVSRLIRRSLARLHTVAGPRRALATTAPRILVKPMSRPAIDGPGTRVNGPAVMAVSEEKVRALMRRIEDPAQPRRATGGGGEWRRANARIAAAMRASLAQAARVIDTESGRKGAKQRS